MLLEFPTCTEKHLYPEKKISRQCDTGTVLLPDNVTVLTYDSMKQWLMWQCHSMKNVTAWHYDPCDCVTLWQLWKCDSMTTWHKNCDCVTLWQHYCMNPILSYCNKCFPGVYSQTVLMFSTEQAKRRVPRTGQTPCTLLHSTDSIAPIYSTIPG